MKLIMNADDFGLTPDVNRAILACIKAGVVKSTTLMINQPGTEHAVEMIKSGLIPEVGLHLTLTSGRPLSDPKDISCLVDEDGYFLNKSVLMNKSDLNKDQIIREFRAQYHWAVNNGLDINHLDSHHFAAVYPALKKAFIIFANEVGLPVRRIDTIVGGQGLLKVPTPDAFDIRFFNHGVSLEKLQNYLLEYKREIPDGVVEFMCHPAMPDDRMLESLSSYVNDRVDELNILTSRKLISWLDLNEIECIGFDKFH